MAVQVEYRLKRAKEAMPNIECINFKDRPIYDQVREKLPYGAPQGPDTQTSGRMPVHASPPELTSVPLRFRALT